MDFPEYEFDSLNETDIREEIIAPLLCYLGYRSGTVHNVIREQPLSYPKSFLGRMKNSDPILRGRADNICEAHGQVRWIIEGCSSRSVIKRLMALSRPGINNPGSLFNALYGGRSAL